MIYYDLQKKTEFSSPTLEGGWTESQSTVDSPYYSLEAHDALHE